MRNATPLLALAFTFAAIFAPARAGADDAGEGAIRDSVVKVYATMRSPDPLRPWTKASPREGSGTGVVIEGKRILTNAHVVLYASQVFVQPHQSGQKVSATVESIAPGIDLAVLKLDDESFFDKRPPLKRVAELPEVKDSVVVYGYPTGGDSLSVTKGIVSRIEFTGYNNQTSGLRIQVDAAINPGNSGGPALVNDAMIGLAFSRLGTADNIGYIIPTEEVDLFLKDVADGKYEGKPAFFDSYQTLENPALRAKLKLPPGTEGMVVKDPAEDVGSTLKTWDVITKVGDREVDSVGKVKAGKNLRLDFRYAVQSLAKDGKVTVSVVRDGKPMEIDLPVQPRRPLLVESLDGSYPSYFVWGPLVFSPASSELLSSLDRQGGFMGFMAAIGSPLATRRGDQPKFPGEELVMISSPLFPHKVSKGYSNPLTKVVKKVDDISIKNLEHLVEVLRDGKSEFVTIEFDDRSSEILVFNRKEVAEATEEILSDNGVRRQSSDDIAPIWSKKAD
ncbi:trypsin-like peptidase domain-containing protein [Isosphaeraceae bacterium EP7]